MSAHAVVPPVLSAATNPSIMPWAECFGPSGSIPTELCELTTLSELDLSSNRLSGERPTSNLSAIIIFTPRQYSCISYVCQWQYGFLSPGNLTTSLRSVSSISGVSRSDPHLFERYAAGCCIPMGPILKGLPFCKNVNHSA